MLQNKYLDAKIGVDTAENEPSKVCLYHGERRRRRSSRRARISTKSAPESRHRATTHHSFRGPFSAASTPIFATKYSFCSILRDLQNELAQFSKFCKRKSRFSRICRICKNVQNVCNCFENSASSFCRSRKMLQNEYLVAKIGVDAAENEPRKE